jgi:uncharacterized protein (TIGR02145 family)
MRIIFFFFFFFFLHHIYSQTPYSIPYQAIIRNAFGNIISSQPVKLRFSIHDSIASGSIVFSETHTLSTNGQGLVNINIGQGSVQTGAFVSINWGKNAKFIQIELDAQNNNTFIDLGTTQLMSVPYALYANNGIKNGNTKGQIMYWNDSTWVLLSPGTQGQVLTFCDGLPYWGDCPNSTSMTYCNKVWSTLNLNVTKYRNGDEIPQVTDPTEWANLTTGAWCWYNNDSLLGIKYGRIYNWYAVNDQRGLAPDGWHIPDISEWNDLFNCIGNWRTMFDIDYWNGGGNSVPDFLNNFSKFSGRPGGLKVGDFINEYQIGCWWSASLWPTDTSYIQGSVLFNSGYYFNQMQPNIGAYIRCVKN